MNDSTTFIKPRQQTASLAFAASVTLAMLMSMNLLATQPAEQAHLAAAASAPQAQLHSATPRT
jgi:hypothetical protein